MFPPGEDTGRVAPGSRPRTGAFVRQVESGAALDRKFPMRILVTGGAGFIGSNFVRRTLEDAYPGLEGAEVVVYDALTYSGNLENLAPVADSPRYSFVQGDIRDVGVL